MFYELFSLEVTAGQDMSFGDCDPRLLQIAAQGNKYIKQFISLRLSWAQLLERLEYLGIDVDQYQADVKANHLDQGLLWLN